MENAGHRVRASRWGLWAIVLGVALVGCGLGRPVVSGRVLDAVSGAALQGARVLAGEVETTTDAEGRYALRLAPGSYELIVLREGYVPQEMTVIHVDGTERLTQDVALARRRLAVRIVAASSGAPVPGARATLGESSATADDDGRLEVEAHTGGALAVACPGYLPLEVPQADVAAALAEPANDAMTVTLTPRALEGTVTRADSGAPVSGTTITVGDATAITDAQGHYRIERVEPGTPITVEGPAHRAVEGLVYEGQERQDVTVEPWKVTLTVTDEAGQPLAGAVAAVGEHAATTDAAGLVEVQPLHGVAITVTLDGYAPATPLYEGQETLSVALAQARLGAQVRNKATGEPVQRARALVYREGQDVPEVVPLDADGRFAIEDARDVARLLIKAPGHRVYEVPTLETSPMDIALEPFEARAVYIPFMLLALPDRINKILTMVDESEELNAVVVDVKGDQSFIAWESEVPLAQEVGAYYRGLMDLDEFLRLCHERDIYVIARMVMFKDDNLASTKPEWMATYADGRPYVDLEGLRWVDPFRREVRDYNLDLAREIALMGFDEVQLDYVRFPSDGSVRGLTFSEESTFESRTRAIAEFCAEMRDTLAPTPAFYSADIFGLVMWVDPGRDMGIGQRMEDVAPFVDYLSPMLYPTTFGPGNLGYQNPGLHPYEVVYRSVRKTQERSDTLVRPWLQHYSIGGIHYGMLELLKQKKAAEDRQSSGWIYWNSRGQYERDLFREGIEEHYADQLPSPEEFEAQEDAARAAQE